MLSTWDGLSHISAIHSGAAVTFNTDEEEKEEETCLICKFPPRPPLFSFVGPHREYQNQLKAHITERDSEPFSAWVNGELLYENDSVNIA